MNLRWIVLAALVVAGCSSRPVAPPVVHAPPLTPSLTPPPVAADWRDAPGTPGTWSYRPGATVTIAAYGKAGAEPDFLMRCDKATRRVTLSRATATAGTMTLKTSYSEQSWPAMSSGARAEVAIAGADPTLDEVAFSRGRFSVAMAGMAMLILPAWAEPARVIEDCRS